jgi:hypothetical protein
MPAEDNKLIAFVSLLTRLTSERKITWRTATPPRGIVEGTDDVIPLYFETVFRDQRISIYQRRAPIYSGDHDRFFWTGDIVISFLDELGRNVWEHSGGSGLFNLFEAVRRSVSNVEGLLDELLKPDREM